MTRELERLRSAVIELLNDMQPADDLDYKIVKAAHTEKLELMVQDIDIEKLKWQEEYSQWMGAG